MAGRRCAGRVLESVAEGASELMVASHNQESVALATRRMHDLGLHPSTSGEPSAAQLTQVQASAIVLIRPDALASGAFGPFLLSQPCGESLPTSLLCRAAMTSACQ